MKKIDVEGLVKTLKGQGVDLPPVKRRETVFKEEIACNFLDMCYNVDTEVDSRGQ